MLGIVFSLLKAFLTRSRQTPAVVYNIATLAAYAETPEVRRILQRAQEENNVELLQRVQAAEDELERANSIRRQKAARPVLEGSPTTYGWKVEERAQSLAIQQGLEDASSSSVFDPHQPRTTPLPLDGNAMKDMFYEYHERNPHLRNMPLSRRNAEELIWTIEGSYWKLTLSSTQAVSAVNAIYGDATPDATVVQGTASPLVRVPSRRRGSILDSELQGPLQSVASTASLYRPTTPTPPPPPSAYMSRSIPKTEQQRVPLSRSVSRTSIIHRLPRVASKLSLASHTTAHTSCEEDLTADESRPTSRDASPARPLRPQLQHHDGKASSSSGASGSGAGSGTIRRSSAIPVKKSNDTIRSSSSRRTSTIRPSTKTRASLGNVSNAKAPVTGSSSAASSPSPSLPQARRSSRQSYFLDAGPYCPPPSPGPVRRGSVASASRPSSRLAQQQRSPSSMSSRDGSPPSPSSASSASSVHTPATTNEAKLELRSKRSSTPVQGRRNTDGKRPSSAQSQRETPIFVQLPPPQAPTRPLLPRRQRSSTVSEETPTLSLNAAHRRAMHVALSGSGGPGSGRRTSTLITSVIPAARGGSIGVNSGKNAAEIPMSVGMARHSSTPSSTSTSGVGVPAPAPVIAAGSPARISHA